MSTKSFLSILALGVIVFSFIATSLAIKRKQLTTPEAAVCRDYGSKSSCEADPCCYWYRSGNVCKKKETCGSSGGSTSCSTTTCNVSVPNNSCSVSVEPGTVSPGGITKVRLTVRPTSCTGSIAVDPFAKLFLPAGLKRVSGYSSNQGGWGVNYYSSDNSYVFDNFNLSYGNSWYVEFSVQVDRYSGGTIKGESWIDLNQTCDSGANVQKIQDTCNASLNVSY